MKKVRNFLALFAFFGFGAPILSTYQEAQQKQKDEYKKAFAMFRRRLYQAKFFSQKDFDIIDNNYDNKDQDLAKKFFESKAIQGLWTDVQNFLFQFDHRYVNEKIENKNYTMEDFLNLIYTFNDQQYKLFPTVRIKKEVLKNIQDFFRIPEGGQAGNIVNRKIIQEMENVEKRGEEESEQEVKNIDKVFFEKIGKPIPFYKRVNSKTRPEDKKRELYKKVSMIKEDMEVIVIVAMLAKDWLETPIKTNENKSHAEIYWSTTVQEWNPQDAVDNNKKKIAEFEKIIEEYCVGGIKFREYVPLFAYALFEYHLYSSEGDIDQNKAPLLRGQELSLAMQKTEAPKNIPSDVTKEYSEKSFEEEKLEKAKDIKEQYKDLSARWLAIDQAKKNEEEARKKFIGEKLQQGQYYYLQRANPVLDEGQYEKMKAQAEKTEEQRQKAVLQKVEQERLRKSSWPYRFWSWFGYQ